jgi:hypothetical protein
MDVFKRQLCNSDLLCLYVSSFELLYFSIQKLPLRTRLRLGCDPSVEDLIHALALGLLIGLIIAVTQIHFTVELFVVVFEFGELRGRHFLQFRVFDTQLDQ